MPKPIASAAFAKMISPTLITMIQKQSAQLCWSASWQTRMRRDSKVDGEMLASPLPPGEDDLKAILFSYMVPGEGVATIVVGHLR